jgi:hypothetical protein
MRALVCAALALQISSVSYAQPLSNGLACPKCQIQSRLVVVLGTVDGSGSLANPYLVDVDSRGRFWVFDENLMPKIYDSTGKFIQEAGRPGKGPGEFESPTTLWRLGGDSVAVVDGGFRLHILDSSLRFVRTITAPVRSPISTVVLDWPRNVVSAAFDRSPARVGLPLHALDFSGAAPKVVRSFGRANTPLGPAEMSRESRYQLTPSRMGGYWAGKVRSYEITKWSATHTMEFTLSRKPDWFAAPSDMLPGGPNRAPSPMLSGVSEDERGLLWVFFFVPSPNYKDAYKRLPESATKPGAAREVPTGVIDWHLIYHTRVEIIDPRSKRLIASHTLPFQATSALPNRRIAVPTFSQDGVPTVQILELTLNGYR